jgi:hypothetical protein
MQLTFDIFFIFSFKVCQRTIQCYVTAGDCQGPRSQPGETLPEPCWVAPSFVGLFIMAVLPSQFVIQPRLFLAILTLGSLTRTSICCCWAVASNRSWARMQQFKFTVTFFLPSVCRTSRFFLAASKIFLNSGQACESYQCPSILQTEHLALCRRSLAL